MNKSNFPKDTDWYDGYDHFYDNNNKLPTTTKKKSVFIWERLIHTDLKSIFLY